MQPRPRRRRFAWFALPVAIAALAVARFAWPDAEQHAMGSDSGPVPVEVAPVARGPIEDVRVLTATLEPSARAVVAAEAAGTVRALHAELADEVEPGRVLAELDDREPRQNEAAARAELSVASARARAAESAAEITTRALQHAERLHGSGIASERELDAAIAASREADAAAEVARAEVARARAALGAAQLQLARARIAGAWSPETGPRRIAARHVDEGARVGVGDPLFTVVDVDPLIAVVTAGTNDRARLETGQRVTIEAGGGTYEGRVARVAPAFDPETRQARVEIEIANPDGALSPGMYVRAHAVLERVESAILIPETALATRGGEPVVFVLDGDAVRMVRVETSLRSEGMVAVRGVGLEGARVVTLGHQRLAEGAAVRVTAGAGESP